MGWTCPHDKDSYCLRLKKDCIPTQKGCVLEGKMVRAIDMYPDTLLPPEEKPSRDKDPSQGKSQP